MPRVADLFDVRYGLNLELNALTLDPQGVNFVGRSARNNGVTGKVVQIPGLNPLPTGTITVAGGGSVMESFLQPQPYYSGRDLYYLTSRVEMTEAQKLYYCSCLRANRYRFNYGRQANRTLRDIQIPALDDLPDWVSQSSPRQFDGMDRPAVKRPTRIVGAPVTQMVPLEQLFTISPGHSLELNRLNISTPGLGVAFVSRKARDNGIAAWVEKLTNVEPFDAGQLTVALSGQGGRLSTYLQEQPFYTSFHVACLKPLLPLTKLQLLYIATCIFANRHRYGFGRQANRSIGSLRVPVPTSASGWATIEQMLGSLRFSAAI